MADSPKCLKCGGTDLKAGKASGAVFFPCQIFIFRPEGMSMFRRSSKPQGVPVKATICLDCGFLEMSVDPEAAKVVIESM